MNESKLLVELLLN